MEFSISACQSTSVRLSRSPFGHAALRFQDLEGIAHTVEVTPESLYEAVAQGLAALRGREWIAGLPQQGMVKVSVADVRVEHQVRLADFTH